MIRMPLLSGSMVKSSCSDAMLAVPVTLITAFSVSKAKICGRATPLTRSRFAAAQLTRTSSSPKICPMIKFPTFSPRISIRLRLTSPSFISSFRLPFPLPSSAATELPVPRISASPFISPRVFCISSTSGISSFSFSRRAWISALPCIGFLSPSRWIFDEMVPPAMPNFSGCRRRSAFFRMIWVERLLSGSVLPCSILRPLKRTSASITSHLSVSKRS